MSEENDMYRRLGSMEGKLDLIIDSSKQRDGRYNKHADRLAEVEKDINTRKGREKALAMGFTAVLGVVGWPHLRDWLSHFWG
mgnify:CR=1 FL=1